MPSFFARSAMRLPTTLAAALFAPFGTWPRRSFSAVDAAASTFAPSPEITCA